MDSLKPEPLKLNKMFKRTFLILIFTGCVTFTALTQEKIELPTPNNVEAKFITENDTNYIALSWDEVKVEGKNIGYNVFINFPPNDQLYLYGKAGVVWHTEYKFPVFNAKSTSYKLSVCSIVNFPQVRRSKKAEVVELITPTTKLPLLQLSDFSNEGNTIHLEWSYPKDIQDLKGFQFIVNNSVLHIISSEERAFFYTFEKEGDYKIVLQAITQNGVQSNITQVRRIVME